MDAEAAFYGIPTLIFSFLVIAFFIIGALALYYAPFLFAYYQKKNNIVAIFIINTAFGWLFPIGWIAAWVMVLWKPENQQVVHHYHPAQPEGTKQ